MKILHWHTSYYPRVGGIPRRVHNFCTCMPEHEHFIVTKAGYKGKPYKPNITEDLGYATIRRFTDSKAPITDQIVEFINKSDADVVIEHYGSLSCVLGPYIKSKPIIASAAADHPKSAYNLQRFKNIAGLVAIRKREGAHIHDEFDQGNNYYLIKPFVDISSFDDYGVGEPTFCYIGRIVNENKGIERMLKFLGGRHLTLIGEPDHDRHQIQFDQIVARLGLNDKIRIVKPIYDSRKLAEEMCKYKYHLFDAHHASFGHSLLETLCCNRIAIISEGHSMDWAKGAAYYNVDINKLDELQPRGREWALKTFNQELVKEQWNILLDKAKRWDF